MMATMWKYRDSSCQVGLEKIRLPVWGKKTEGKAKCFILQEKVCIVSSVGTDNLS